MGSDWCFFFPLFIALQSGSAQIVVILTEMEDGKYKQKNHGDFLFFFFWMDPWHDAWAHTALVSGFVLNPTGEIASFGTLALHSGHCSALFGFTINSEIPTAHQRKYFSSSQNHLPRWTAVKTLGLLYLLKNNSLFLGQITKRRRNSEVWCLNTACEKLPKHMFTSEGLCGSPASDAFEQTKVKKHSSSMK